MEQHKVRLLLWASASPRFTCRQAAGMMSSLTLSLYTFTSAVSAQRAGVA
ncbi:MAG: hypothetical protein IJU72_05755 [Bacteroidales bacterium]|nr:hypothetical protein [Bacteroidales bacterium]